MVNELVITNTRPEHIERLELLTSPPGWAQFDNCFRAEHLAKHIECFPEGQFVALLGDQVVGYAITMRTHRSPQQKPLAWLDAIGDMTLCDHHPNGEWLYGVDFAVRGDMRRRGIGTRLYNARFKLVKQLNLRGFYAGGVLANYHKYCGQMSLREYGDKVMCGEIDDPTVTMQINRGFVPRAVIENYVDYAPSRNGAMLITWANPAYQPVVLTAKRAALA